MPLQDRLRFGLDRRFMLAVAVGVCAIFLVLFFSPAILAPRLDIIGILDIKGPILSSDQVDAYSEALREAGLNDSVRGIVVRIDSPGGYADLVEQVYLDILELKQKKPVVASVVTGLSGGYYIAVAADYVYVSPTSMVGNVGVIGVGPPVLVPSDVAFETGAHKVTGYSRLLFPFNLSRALESFATAVEKSRTGKLKLSPRELRRGSIYLGREAVDLGMADGIGSVQSAISKIVHETGLFKYSVLDLAEEVARRRSVAKSASTGLPDWQDITIERLNQLHPPPAVYYLYLPTNSSFYTSGVKNAQLGGSEQSSSAEGLVLIDRSHGNLAPYWEFDVLVRELSLRNRTASFEPDWESLESKLQSASALIIAAPTQPYSGQELDRIRDFVRSGRVLLLFYDPTAEYVDVPALTEPINSVALAFGVSYANGYLYNEQENYGIYRNIYITHFSSNPLTRNLTKIVLFTSANMFSRGRAVAWASNVTMSSFAERSGSYEVIEVVSDNGTMAAFGDMTFMQEPYCYVEDNLRLVQNMASLVADVKTGTEGGERESERSVNLPDLPVGTHKQFLERVDGKESRVDWYKVSEFEIRIEMPDSTTRQFLDERGALARIVEDGVEVVYESPLPDPPFPISEGKSWSYSSAYMLSVVSEGMTYRGNVTVDERVTHITPVEALNGEEYLCAEIEYTHRDALDRDGVAVIAFTSGKYWLSEEVGNVKEEDMTSYFLGGILVSTQTRLLLLSSVRK